MMDMLVQQQEKSELKKRQEEKKKNWFALCIETDPFCEYLRSFRACFWCYLSISEKSIFVSATTIFVPISILTTFGCELEKIIQRYYHEPRTTQCPTFLPRQDCG